MDFTCWAWDRSVLSLAQGRRQSCEGKRAGRTVPLLPPHHQSRSRRADEDPATEPSQEARVSAGAGSCWKVIVLHMPRSSGLIARHVDTARWEHMTPDAGHPRSPEPGPASRSLSPKQSAYASGRQSCVPASRLIALPPIRAGGESRAAPSGPSPAAARGPTPEHRRGRHRVASAWLDHPWSG